MSDMIERGRDKLHDPILMSWALRCYGHAKRQGPEHCLPLEDAWFGDLTLARGIEAGDHAVLTELFDTLPSRRFANLKPAVIERWPSWSGRLGARATLVLLDSPVAVARPLLARHIKDNLRDTEKTLAVIAALPDLPRPDAVALLNDVTRQVFELDDGENGALIKRVLSQALLQPTAALEPEALRPLIGMCARAAGGDSDQTWQFFREDELSAKGLAEDFAKLFNRLRPKLGPGRPLLPAALLSDARVKAGRAFRTCHS